MVFSTTKKQCCLRTGNIAKTTQRASLLEIKTWEFGIALIMIGGLRMNATLFENYLKKILKWIQRYVFKLPSKNVCSRKAALGLFEMVRGLSTLVPVSGICYLYSLSPLEPSLALAGFTPVNQIPIIKAEKGMEETSQRYLTCSHWSHKILKAHF